MLVVVDTNVLVSALINPTDPPARIVEEIRTQALQPVIAAELIAEYHNVLTRTRFGFSLDQVESLLDDLTALSLYLNATRLDTGALPDPDDAPFIAVALAAACPIVTGNGRDFPTDLSVEILTPVQCLRRLLADRGANYE